ncbi:MAG: T9SS type A sorting domain-containing protein [Chitinophagales bacterium]|nr:T9SS type A sorting domain-containing protein [Chitinophagales bacterium]
MFQKISLDSEQNETQDARGYIDYMYRIRANQITGKLDLNDEVRAYNAAETLVSSRSLGIQWQEMGPDNVGGRTRAILFDAKNANVVFAAGVSGGLWKSTNGGQSWQNIGDQYKCLTIVSLAQGPTGDIYFGTGEGLYFNNGTGTGGFIGQGIWKSTDGGNFFSQLQSTQPVSAVNVFVDWADVNRIAVSPNDPNRVYAATNTGLKVSHDGGLSWVAVYGPVGVISSTDVKTGNDGYVHASIGNKYYRSTAPDGDDFQLPTGQSSFFTGSFSRIELAVAQSDANYVYASTVNSSGGMAGVFQSTDAGLSWTQIGPGNSVNFNPFAFFEPQSGGQGDYDDAVTVSLTDPQTIFVGGSGIMYRYTSTTGWVKIVDAYQNPFFGFYVHPDMHALVFNPFKPTQMLIGCDGGVYITDNALQDQPEFYSADRNYRVTQMYSVAAAATGEVTGGTQDNGTIYIDFLGNTTMSGDAIFGGDGGYTEISHNNPDAFFGGTPNGVLFRSPSKGGGASTFFDFRIDKDNNGKIDEGAEFVTPFILWEQLDSPQVSFYACGSSKSIWFTPYAVNFSIIPDWFRLSSTIGAVSCISFSHDGNDLYAGTTAGYVYHCGNIKDVFNAGKFHYSSPTSTVWNVADSGIKVTSVLVASGRYIRSVAIDPTNNNNIVVTAGNYGNTSYVWKSNNALSDTIVMADITGDLPMMPVYGSTIDISNPNNLIVGTDFGVYSQDLSTGVWSEENTGMAHVPTLMVRQIPFNTIPYLYIATHGRGIFRSSTLAGVNVGISSQNTILDNVIVFPNPVSSLVNVNLNLAKPALINISIFDLNGKHFANELHNLPSGENTVAIKTNSLANGTYLLKVQAESSVFTKKFVVIK